MAWLVTGKEISFIKKSRENDEFYTHKKKNENAEGKIFNDGLNIFRLNIGSKFSIKNSTKNSSYYYYFSWHLYFNVFSKNLIVKSYLNVRHVYAMLSFVFDLDIFSTKPGAKYSLNIHTFRSRLEFWISLFLRCRVSHSKIIIFFNGRIKLKENY